MNRKHIASIAVAATALALSIGTAEAAQGCGPGGWRNVWGQCRYSAPVVVQSPVVYATPAAPVSTYACPPGYWLGPWGHCRDTPYHGRLPNGMYQ
ncbi:MULTISPECIES: GCG_CRPN prefix-to-repeats domain-containing protein [Paraburkholderia]|uniref:Lipoprotein n=2 Tax=Paraburkholderia TaxID=1822464 RepID=A0A7Z7FKB5_9BURK|nr:MULTISPECIES: hypothetical protein [Paraburkholderia]AUT64068.1 hypothetical protein C2L65_30495 [Paraburkholderia terrae]SDI39730.1 hypothetical protein SAMN04487926_11669 [Paraburkholderia steynii]